MKSPDPSVGGVGLPFDQSEGLELIDDAGKRDRLHVEEPRQSALIDPFVSVQIRQHLPLRSGQPGTPRMLLESLFEQPRDFMQQKG
jgi:hypothetical protein